jgi:hypothetical protein
MEIRLSNCRQRKKAKKMERRLIRERKGKINTEEEEMEVKLAREYGDNGMMGRRRN